ncbi:MAG: hypothetical protein ACHQ1D_02375 [Nitrososphaerales archaeon]
MNSYGAVGSYVQLTFQTKFPTFTPDQFMASLKDKNYSMTQGTANLPSGQMITTQIFSKQNLSVFISPSTNQIFFQILNTINPQEIIEKEIKNILVYLNIVEEVLLSVMFTFNTSVPSKGDPHSNLTSLLDQKFRKHCKDILQNSLGVTSLRLASSFPIEKDGLQLIVEPLGTDPKHRYYLNLTYVTDKMHKFNDFIDKFGERMVLELMDGIDKNE